MQIIWYLSTNSPVLVHAPVFGHPGFVCLHTTEGWTSVQRSSVSEETEKNICVGAEALWPRWLPEGRQLSSSCGVTLLPSCTSLSCFCTSHHPCSSILKHPSSFLHHFLPQAGHMILSLFTASIHLSPYSHNGENLRPPRDRGRDGGTERGRDGSIAFNRKLPGKDTQKTRTNTHTHSYTYTQQYLQCYLYSIL